MWFLDVAKGSKSIKRSERVKIDSLTKSADTLRWYVRGQNPVYAKFEFIDLDFADRTPQNDMGTVHLPFG